MIGACDLQPVRRVFRFGPSPTNVPLDVTAGMIDLVAPFLHFTLYILTSCMYASFFVAKSLSATRWRPPCSGNSRARSALRFANAWHAAMSRSYAPLDAERRYRRGGHCA
jgi:hypothetical protein